MSRFNEEMEKYRAQMDEIALEGGYQDGFLEREAERLGPNIYDADASLVSCTDKAEIDRVKATFNKRFDGLDEALLEDAIQYVCNIDMAGQKRKYRAVFYYILTVRLGQLGEGGSLGEVRGC